MSSAFGNCIKISIFGQSHSEAIGVVIDGLKAGFKLNTDEINSFMKRRAPGQNAVSTPRAEADEFHIISGVVDNITCGALPDYFIHPRSNGIASIGLPHSAVRASCGYVLLNPAFRSLSRPSSPCSSMASAINLFSLDHIIVSSSALRHRLCQARALSRSQVPSGYVSNFAAEDSLLLYCILPLSCIRSRAAP